MMQVSKGKHTARSLFIPCALLVLLGLLVLEGFRAHSSAQEVQNHLLLPKDGFSNKRKKVAAFFGVLTAPHDDYLLRRKSLRKSWFPRSQAELDRWEKEHSLVVRFVMGHSGGGTTEKNLKEEEEKFGQFFRLDIEENYHTLTTKILVYFKTVREYYDADYVFKVDDDIFILLERIPYLVHQWEAQNSDYIGCLIRGGPIDDPGSRWHETQQQLIGSEYYAHARGAIYALSRRAANIISDMPYGSVRFFTNEDVTMGTWMAALNVTFFDDQRLCSIKCTETSVAIYDADCSGLCDTALTMIEMYGKSECRGPPLPEGKEDLPIEDEKVKMLGVVSEELSLSE